MFGSDSDSNSVHDCWLFDAHANRDSNPQPGTISDPDPDAV